MTLGTPLKRAEKGLPKHGHLTWYLQCSPLLYMAVFLIWCWGLGADKCWGWKTEQKKKLLTFWQNIAYSVVFSREVTLWGFIMHLPISKITWLKKDFFYSKRVVFLLPFPREEVSSWLHWGRSAFHPPPATAEGYSQISAGPQLRHHQCMHSPRIAAVSGFSTLQPASCWTIRSWGRKEKCFFLHGVGPGSHHCSSLLLL